MKKAFLILTVLLFSSFCFAESSIVRNYKNIVMRFFERGDYIIVYYLTDNCNILNKTAVKEIFVSDSEIIITNIDKEVLQYNYKAWKIFNDDRGNLVISPSIK